MKQRTWTDTLGRTWTIEVTPVVIAKLRQAIGFDLSARQFTLRQLKRLTDKLQKPNALPALLEIIFTDQVRQRGLTDEEFVKGLDGDGVARVLGLFFDQLIDRTPRLLRPQLRAELGKWFGPIPTGDKPQG